MAARGTRYTCIGDIRREELALSILTWLLVVGTLSLRARACPGNSCGRPSRKTRTGDQHAETVGPARSGRPQRPNPVRGRKTRGGTVGRTTRPTAGAGG